MPDNATRDRIVETADRLFYRQGFEHTSFADIAGAVKISRGNFYYHFRIKDEILDAVIERRLAGTKEMLRQWELAGETPRDRIASFIRMLLVNRADIQRWGCPVGSLCGELVKLGHGAEGEARAPFVLFRSWLRRQFTLMGRRADADALAMHVLAMSQGVATLANAFHDESFIRREVERMLTWLQSIEEA